MPYQEFDKTDSANNRWILENLSFSVNEGGLILKISKIKILVVDDHPLTLKGISLVLDQDPLVEVVATLDKGVEVISTVLQRDCDLVLLDLELHDMNGLSLLDELIKALDATVIILTGTNNRGHLNKALSSGVRCIVSKVDSCDFLLPAIRSAIAGERFLSPGIVALIGKTLPSNISLSPRQLEILNLLSAGETNKEIGYKLGIKAPTVSFHLAELRFKLSAENNRKILARARELQII